MEIFFSHEFHELTRIYTKAKNRIQETEYRIQKEIFLATDPCTKQAGTSE